MLVKRSLLALSMSMALAACGGSSDTVTETPTPTPTPAPTPEPAPAPTSQTGVFTGSATLTDSSTETSAVLMVAAEDEAVLVVGQAGTAIHLDLTAGSDGSIDQSATAFWDGALSGSGVNVTGARTDDGYTLTVSENGSAQVEVSVTLDSASTDSSPALNGYYERDNDSMEGLGVVIEDGIIEGNDTSFCHYEGSYTEIAGNVYAIDMSVSSIEPYVCSAQGDYTGLATALADTNGFNAAQPLLIAAISGEKGLFSALSKQSDSPQFATLPPGLYQKSSDNEFEDLSFAVSHDGEIRGVVQNKLFAGYFDATPSYMGEAYSAYDSNVLFYEKSFWHLVQGYLVISDLDWQSDFEQPDAQQPTQTASDQISVEIGITEDPPYLGNIDLSMAKLIRNDYPVQFSTVVGRYVAEGAGIDMVIDDNGTISGKHHSCDLTGQLSEKPDTPIQEFTIELTRTNCPGVNNFSLNGQYSGFGYASLLEDGSQYKLDLFMFGSTDIGGFTNLLSVNSFMKQ